MKYVRPTPLKPWSYFPLGLRAYRDTFRFTGRARRWEVAEFYILSMFVNLAIGVLAMAMPDIASGTPGNDVLVNALARDAVKFLLTLPAFALMARRIQDFGLPGWALSPLPLYAVAINEWRTVAIFTDIAEPSWLAQLPALAIVVAMLVAVFIPGDEGSNRYGPDPREEPEEPSAPGHPADRAA